MAARGNVSGLTERNFRRAARSVAAAARGLNKTGQNGPRLIGEEIMLDVKASRPGAGVPRDKGHLAASGKVTQLNARQVELGFGDSTVDYALIQHEVTTYHHTLGEARYLVRGLERWRPDGSAALVALKAQSEAAITAARRV